jgi:uncharacterized protein (TIGR03435 family)
MVPLEVACCAAVLIPIFFGALCAGQGAAAGQVPSNQAVANQAPAAALDHDIVGTWQGTLHVPAAGGRPAIDLRIVNKITKGDDGKLKVMDYSIDQGGGGMTASSASFQDGEFKYAIQAIDGSYEGKMSADCKSITGNWTQGPNPLPLLLERATPETEWTIPPPPVRLPPMAADANPSFEVATIKPTAPDEQRKAFAVRGNHFITINTSLSELMAIGYGLQQKQIVGALSWMDTDKWDIEAQPDVPGTPNKQQLMTMVQKLLADRFQLKFHKDSKEMSAYVLTVAKGGQKMTKSDAGPNQLPGFGIRGLGVLTVQNATMSDFVGMMQSQVLDRPVVDQTALEGKWNFLLKWTPDESQFGGMGAKVPPPSDAADAPPPLFTAIQEQIGLKLDAGKAQVPVLVIDKAEKPSAN